MRVLDAAFLAEARKSASPLVYFIEFATPSQSGGTLTRVSSGLEADVQASGLSDLSDFTDLDADGAWSLSGGRIVAQFPFAGATRSRLRYDGVASTIGKVVQVFSERDQNTPGDPDNSSGFPAALSCIGQAGGGIGMERRVTLTTAVLPRLMQEALIADCDLNPAESCAIGQTKAVGRDLDTTLVGTQTWSTHYVDPGYAEARHFNALDEVLSASPGTTPPDGPCGLWVRWEQCDCPSNFFIKSVGFTRLTIMGRPWIKVLGLPAGWKAEVTGPLSGFAPILTPSAGLGTATFLTLRATAMPAQKIALRDSTGSLAGVDVNDGLVAWGDTYQYTPPADTPIANFCTADMDLDWDGKSWKGLGRENVGFDGVSETGRLRGQGVSLSFSGVDLGAVLNLIRDTRHRGGIVRLWAAHYDETTGDVHSGTATQLIFRGFSQGGFEYEEERPGDPREAGTASLTCRVASHLAEIQQIRGLRTNNNVLQRFYPGETGAQNVPRIQGQTIYWGREGPARPPPGLNPFRAG